MITKGLVKLNMSPAIQNYKVKGNDLISIFLQDPVEPSLIPEPLPLKLLYHDDSLVVADKPAGMVVYPSVGHESGTLINGIYYYCKKTASVGMPLRPGIVHRLDKDTSGAIVVALEDNIYYNLIEQFRSRSIKRKYLAIIYGCLKTDTGQISFSIGRSTRDRKKMSVNVSRGKEAITTWKVLKRYEGASLIELRLGTGRTHQIRVHMSALGHPVLGDRVYGSKTSVEIGKKRYPLNRQMLHAETLGFIHPFKDQYMEFHSEMPEDMQECLYNLSQ